MKTYLREWLTRYQCVIRPKVHFAHELSFKCWFKMRSESALQTANSKENVGRWCNNNQSALLCR